MQKVIFNTVQSVTKTQNGIVTIGLKTDIGTADEATQTVGVVNYAKGGTFEAITLAGDVLGMHDTRSAAGHALARFVQGKVKQIRRTDEVKFVTVAAAAKLLGKGASTIRRHAKANTIASKIVDGVLMVAA